MNTKPLKQRSGRTLACLIGALLVLLPFGLSADEPSYAIQASVLHLGEVVASPAVVVVEGRTARIHSSEAPQYTMAFLVQKRVGDSVSLSFDFHSGNLSIQPNVEVPLNETYQINEDRLVVELFIKDLDS